MNIQKTLDVRDIINHLEMFRDGIELARKLKIACAGKPIRSGNIALFTLFEKYDGMKTDTVENLISALKGAPEIFDAIEHFVLYETGNKHTDTKMTVSKKVYQEIRGYLIAHEDVRKMYGI